LLVAGKVLNVQEGILMARNALENGQARDNFRKLIRK
jgi:anthranilate phosphoribosyltransferase